MKAFTSLFVGLALFTKNILALWPIPHSYSYGTSNLEVASHGIHIENCGVSTDILSKALIRYSDLIFSEKFVNPVDYNAGKLETDGTISALKVNVLTACTDLDVDTDEFYTLNITSTGEASITSNTSFGAIRGLETFSQLISYNYGRKIIKNVPISISDKPSFTYRGLMIDTARNYYSVDSIKRTMDGMVYSKLNVLHWHIVDSQSWPIESLFDPQLYIKGSYAPEMVYTRQNVLDVISYGKERGIRVIPEFDMPGHTYIIGLSNPKIMSCLNTQPMWTDHAAEPPSGQFNIAKPEAIEYAQNIVKEYSALFPDNVFHVGGDEVNRKCWEDDPYVKDFISKNSSLSVDSLLTGFYSNIYDTISHVKKTPMCWQETLLHTNFTVPKDTIIQVWIEPEDVPTVVNKGYRVITSPYMYSYLDCGHGSWLSNDPAGNSWCDPFKTWKKIYSYNPLVNITDPEKQKLVLGGEVNLWSEQADETNVDKLLWPRAAAASELYWSGPYMSGNTTLRNLTEVSARINEHRFRLLARGIDASPTQPLWCVRNPGMCDLPPSKPLA
ncbi:hypothetical protein BB560_000666 [Smittium megazygosporum]|uniref:Beta-hexosaminidase n=1 Tax=Smittium megazygosporum TaxID=133381 RepID=A0A2T9ZJR8_9FUNG|nr:hypothetical protein BB560_000666 [Smittium megazygosporum]